MKNPFISLKKALSSAKQNVAEKAIEAAATPQNGAPKVTISVDVPARVQLRVLIITALFFGLMSALGQLQGLIITLLVVLFLALGLSPFVTKLERWLPRPIAILLLFILFFGVLVVLAVQVVPLLATQISQLISATINGLQSNPESLAWLTNILQIEQGEFMGLIQENAQSLTAQFRSVGGATLGAVGNIFGGLFDFFFGLALLFFVLLEREGVGRFVLHLFPKNDRERILAQSGVIQHKISQWFRGQIILMVSIGVLMFIGLTVFEHTMGMEYALTISILAGIMELFPYVGLFITELVSALVAANHSWQLVVAVLGWIFFIQFLEGNVLVPLVMKNSTGLSSVVVILSLTIAAILGTALGGIPLAILFMILAVPITASAYIFLSEYLNPTPKDLEPKE